MLGVTIMPINGRIVLRMLVAKIVFIFFSDSVIEMLNPTIAQLLIKTRFLTKFSATVKDHVLNQVSYRKSEKAGVNICCFKECSREK